MIRPNHKLLKNVESKLDCKIDSYKTLGNGEHNLNFLLKTDKNNFVLRINANVQFNNSKKEYQTLNKLNGKFAPKVFFFDDSKLYCEYDHMVQEFVEGITLKKFSTDDLKQLAKLLKEIHKIKGSRDKKEWKEMISSWSRKNILQNSKFLGVEFHKNMKQLYSKVSEELEQIQPLIKKYSRTHLIHDDIIPENVIRTREGKLILVDWEFARFDYFFFEFGCLFAENNLSTAQEETFFREYGFGLKPNEKKIIHAIKINRVLSLISWLTERITSIKQGKQMFVGEKISKYQKLLKKEINHIHKLL